MGLSTSHESDMTDAKAVLQGLWKKMESHDYAEYDPTEATIYEERASSNLDGPEMHDQRRISMPIDALEGSHVKIRFDGQAIESALASCQDSSTPQFSAQTQHGEIRSVGPQRRFLARGLIKRVRRIGPSKIDPSWVR